MRRLRNCIPFRMDYGAARRTTDAWAQPRGAERTPLIKLPGKATTAPIFASAVPRLSATCASERSVCFSFRRDIETASASKCPCRDVRTVLRASRLHELCAIWKPAADRNRAQRDLGFQPVQQFSGLAWLRARGLGKVKPACGWGREAFCRLYTPARCAFDPLRGTPYT